MPEDKEALELEDVAVKESVEAVEDGVEDDGAIDKHAKFRKLSEARIQKAAKYIVALGNLSNKASYEYSVEEAEKMFMYLQKLLDDTKAKFAEKKESHFSW